MFNANAVSIILIVFMVAVIWFCIGGVVGDMVNKGKRENLFVLLLWPIVTIIIFVKRIPKDFNEFIQIVFKGGE